MLSRALLVALVLATVACGKKGPPLLPYQRQPAAAEVTAARRIGNDVYVTVTVPTANIDDSRPASVSEIEVYGVTAATAPPQSQFVSIAERVATIPVARDADPSDKSGTVVPDPKTGALQGTSVTIRDSLTPEKMKPRELPASATSGRDATRQAALSGRSAPQTVAAGKPAAQEASSPSPAAAPEAPRRFYMTIPFSARKRPGPPSKIVDVPMTSVPDKVLAIRATMKGRNVELAWEPAGGLVGFLLDRALPVETPPVDERPAAASPGAKPQTQSGPTLYNVYVELAPDTLALPAGPATESPPAAVPALPVNREPLAMLSFSEEVPFDERRRCYHVRAVRGSGAQRVEGEASERSCIVPVDTEPPAAPTGLLVTSDEGSISLRWEPNGEEDFRGYLVLRSEAGDDTLRLLTRDGPIADTKFTDSTVMSGRMYTYVVQAVDNRIPVPNVSDPTEIPVTAR